jgi:cell division protein FtsQ
VRKLRRARPSPATRLRAYWLFGIVVLGLLAWGAYELLLWPGFHLTDTQVSGARVAAIDEVIARAALDPEANLWMQNMYAAERRVEKIPYVRSARAYRFLPASVRIDVVERRPDGCVEARNGDRFTVDADQRVLESECGEDVRPLYRLADLLAAPSAGVFLHRASLMRLQNDAHALQRLQPGVFTVFATDRFGQMEARMRSGIVVRFGDERNFANKARLVRPILAAARGRATPVKAVDVRVPEAPVLEFQPPTHAQD